MKTEEIKMKKFFELEIDKIKPYQKNNKVHPDSQLEKLKDSIKNYGFLGAIIVDENFEILAWHWRRAAAKLAWLEKIPCIQELDLNEKQKKSFRIEDNILADLWLYHEENLKLELKEINNPNLTALVLDDLKDINFDLPKIQNIELTTENPKPTNENFSGLKNLEKEEPNWINTDFKSDFKNQDFSPGKKYCPNCWFILD